MYAWLKPSTSILPPGAQYAVYAPQRSIVTGRFFYNLSSLHITEAARTLLKFGGLGSDIRAQWDSLAAWETLTRLLAVIPNVDAPRTPSLNFVEKIDTNVGPCSIAYQAASRAHGHVPISISIHGTGLTIEHQVSYQPCWRGCAPLRVTSNQRKGARSQFGPVYRTP